MNLKSLSDSQLLETTKTLVAREREVMTSILWHLEEIERRRLFSDLGCSSLYTYAVEVLGYSEDQAYRRISAMRLLRTMPELEDKIQSGQLSVSNLSLAQTVIRREAKTIPLTQQKKQELVARLENKTSREAQVIALDYSSTPSTLAPERERPLSEQFIELKFTVSKSTLKKIHRLKGLRAHRTPHLSTSDLLDQLCDLALKHWDPGCEVQCDTSEGETPEDKRRVVRAKGTGTARASTLNSTPNGKTMRETGAAAEVTVRFEPTKKAEPIKKSEPTTKLFSRAIPVKTVRRIWVRDRGECRICRSRYALQVDHIHPRSFGGSNDESNLRLLCRTCNQRQAIKKIGMRKMAHYLDFRKTEPNSPWLSRRM